MLSVTFVFNKIFFFKKTIKNLFESILYIFATSNQLNNI